MTTQFKVMCEGPGAIKLEHQGRDDKGQYYQVAEHIVRPGEFKTIIMVGSGNVQVIELKGPPPVEPA